MMPGAFALKPSGGLNAVGDSPGIGPQSCYRRPHRSHGKVKSSSMEMLAADYLFLVGWVI
jgi:hypothetical protein